MELTAAERRYVRDGWRSFLYRVCPELKTNRAFTRKLLDHLCSYNQQFLNALSGDAATLDEERTPLADFLDDAREAGDISDQLFDVLAASIRIRVRPGRLD
jgi:hypothetical protein